MKMDNQTVVNFSIVNRDLSILRDKYSDNVAFKHAMKRISLVLAVELGKDLANTGIQIETPLEQMTGSTLKNSPLLLPVLRAGLGMLDGFREIFPESPVGMIGTKRNEETLEAQNYYINIPSLQSDVPVFLLDPMLATGGTGIHAIRTLMEMGYHDISYISVISAPEGISRVKMVFPRVKIFTCSIDRALNSNGYILPGLGDAGDRYFST